MILIYTNIVCFRPQNLVNKMDADKLRMKSSLEDKLRKRREEKLRSKQRDLEDRSEDDQREFAEKQRNAKDRAVADEVIFFKCILLLLFMHKPGSLNYTLFISTVFFQYFIIISIMYA